jgi:hypothetical protein
MVVAQPETPKREAADSQGSEADDGGGRGQRYVRVLAARHDAEATLARDALQSHGIRVELRHRWLAGMGGEIPVADARIGVMAPIQDAARAMQILADIDAEADGPPRTCAACGEQSPSGFEVCWSCQTPFDTDDPAPAVLADPLAPDTTAQPTPPASGFGVRFWSIVLMACGGALGVLFLLRALGYR